MGNYASFLVGVNPAIVQIKQEFKTDTIITSPIKVTPKSTFTVNPDVTITLEGTAAKFEVPVPEGTPTAGSAPIKINGTIEISAGAEFAMPNMPGANAAGFLDYGPEGKIVVKEGGIASINATPYVGPASSSAYYKMAADSEIELKDHYMGLTKGTVHLAISTAIQATDIAEAARGAVFVIDNGVILSLRNNSTTAATLKGEGKVVTGTAVGGKYPTEIVGGPNGWQSKGTATDGAINFTGATTGGFTITAAGTPTKSVLTALGPGATITQNVVGNLTIAADTVIELGGTTTAKAGQVILIGDGTDPGKITFATTTSSVQIGATTALSNPYAAAAKIGNVAIGTSSASIYTDIATTPFGPGKFIGVKGTSTSQTLVGGVANTTISIDRTQTVSN
jgi:hypothetical protein